MKTTIRVFVAWLPLALTIIGVCGLIYIAVQQNYRQSLNDPQIQMAEDDATALGSGATTTSIVPKQSIDVAASLAPWIAVYDSSGTPVASSGLLDGKIPVPPLGEFNLALAQGNNLPHDTWEPVSGVRIAAVIVPIPHNGGFVLVGRNMREVEDRETNLEAVVGIGMIVLLVSTFITKLFANGILKRWN